MISVLLVDDEPVILDIARAFLERHGEFNVTTIQSAKEALTNLGEKTFDAVVSDYEMPEMNGLEFLRTIREQGNLIPFIIFTGRGREDVVIEALNIGADYYIQKGGDPRAQFTELAYKIREAVRKRKEVHAAVTQDHIRIKLMRHIHALSDLVDKLEQTGLDEEQKSFVQESKKHVRELLLSFGERV